MTTMHGYGNVLAAASALLGSRAVVAALAAVLGAGCSSSGGAPPAGAVLDGGGDAGPSRLVFSPCPLVTVPFTAPPTGPRAAAGFAGGPSPIGDWLIKSSGLDAAGSAKAECATTKLPAVWSDPKGDSIDVFVKRYPAAVQPAKGQLWLLEGGPGYAGSAVEWMAFLIAATIPTLDIYMPDHRGTGKSTLAECPQGATPAECPAAIPHLDGLTTTGGARDLAALIDASRAGSQQVFVYGLSYGTYWALRYLQVRPDQPTAVILDSVVPVGMDYADYNRHFDDKAHAVLALCQADATCSAKLGPDPLAKAEQAIAVEAGSGACVLGGVRQYLNGAILGDYFDRLLLPASIYRTIRCNDADRAWFEKVRAYSEWEDGHSSAGFSDVVEHNIVVSELWHSNATAEELWAEMGTMLAFNGGPAVWANLATYWPKYPRDAYYGQWPSSPAPILVLQGGLDARTPYGDIVKAQYSGKNQYYVELPRAVHVAAWPLSSPMADLKAPACGWQVIRSFLADPRKAPDTSCIAGMMPIDFGNPPPEWLALVGIQDLWENP